MIWMAAQPNSPLTALFKYSKILWSCQSHFSAHECQNCCLEMKKQICSANISKYLVFANFLDRSHRMFTNFQQLESKYSSQRLVDVARLSVIFSEGDFCLTFYQVWIYFAHPLSDLCFLALGQNLRLKAFDNDS